MADVPQIPARKATITGPQLNAQESSAVPITRHDTSDATRPSDIEEAVTEELALPRLPSPMKDGEAEPELFGPVLRSEIPDSEDFSSSPVSQPTPTADVTGSRRHDDGGLGISMGIAASSQTENPPNDSVVGDESSCPDVTNVDTVSAVEPRTRQDEETSILSSGADGDLQIKDILHKAGISSAHTYAMELATNSSQDKAAHLAGDTAVQLDGDFLGIADSHILPLFTSSPPGTEAPLTPLPRNGQSLKRISALDANLPIPQDTSSEVVPVPLHDVAAEPGIWMNGTISQEMMTSPVTAVKDFAYPERESKIISSGSPFSSAIALSQTTDMAIGDTPLQDDLAEIPGVVPDLSTSRPHRQCSESGNTTSDPNLHNIQDEGSLPDIQPTTAACSLFESNTRSISLVIPEPISSSNEKSEAADEDDVDMIDVPSSPPTADNSEPTQQLTVNSANPDVLQETEHVTKDTLTRSFGTNDEAPQLQNPASTHAARETSACASSLAEKDMLRNPTLRTAAIEAHVRGSAVSVKAPVPPSPEEKSNTPTASDSRPSSQKNKEALRAELKAIKMSSIQTRISSLEAEIASKRAKLAEVTEELKYDAPANTAYDPATTVKTHIKLLHDYNDIRDVGQGLLGMIADSRGVRVGTIYEEFGVDQKD
ncbi:hypothetical protein BP6252_02322 [Coleophoma cylindrospora]|uniref:Swi5-domain-containing protein n=1 Tax=Coleophoma cylindrospora TaxID=1849047 RepID=A0A3D8SEI4_9HELO|nr:hypothetical protein BP6252_02322 [Coleophoma cylindrospora]